MARVPSKSEIDARMDQLRRLPYLREIWPDPDGMTWRARVVEIRGCAVTGATREDALRKLDDALYGWIFTLEQDGDAVPAPLLSQDYSGKTVVRLGEALHRDSRIAAARQDVSLNHFISTAVARAIGAKETDYDLNS